MKKYCFMLLLLCSLFLVVGCEDKEEKGNKKNEEVKENIRDFTEVEEKALMKIVDDLKYLDYFDKSFEIKDLTNQELLRTSISIYNKKSNYSGKYTIRNLEDVAKEYFDYKLVGENVECESHWEDTGGSKYISLFDDYTGTFVYNDEHYGHGGGGFSTEVYNRFKSGEVKDDKYILKVYKLFSGLSTDVMEEDVYYFNSYNNAARNKDKLFKAKYNFETDRLSVDPQDKLDKMEEEKLIIYTYIFEVKNGNYILKSYKIGQ